MKLFEFLPFPNEDPHFKIWASTSGVCFFFRRKGEQECILSGIRISNYIFFWDPAGVGGGLGTMRVSVPANHQRPTERPQGGNGRGDHLM